MVAIQMEIRNELDLGFCKIKYYDNGIFHVHHRGKNPLTLEEAKLISQKRLEFTQGKSCPVLSTADGCYNMPTKEASEYLRDDARAEHTLANAYVIVNFPQRLAIKAMATFRETKYPTAGFNTMEEAVDWLLEI